MQGAGRTVGKGVGHGAACRHIKRSGIYTNIHKGRGYGFSLPERAIAGFFIEMIIRENGTEEGCARIAGRGKG